MLQHKWTLRIKWWMPGKSSTSWPKCFNSYIHVGDLHEVPGSWLQSNTALPVIVTWGVFLKSCWNHLQSFGESSRWKTFLFVTPVPMSLSEREEEINRNLPFTGSLPQGPQWQEWGQPEASSGSIMVPESNILLYFPRPLPRSWIASGTARVRTRTNIWEDSITGNSYSHYATTTIK